MKLLCYNYHNICKFSFIDLLLNVQNRKNKNDMILPPVGSVVGLRDPQLSNQNNIANRYRRHI